MELQKVKVKVKLLEPMLGTTAKDKEIYKSFIETKKPADVKEDEAENIEEIEERGWTGFLSDKNGLFVYDYFIKGFFKNAGNIMRNQLKIRNLKSKIIDTVYIFPRKVYLGQKEPDGVIERPIRCETQQGKRVSLARSDKVKEGTEFEFEVQWLKGTEITEKIIRELLLFGKLCGFVQFRTGGYGRFEVIAFGKGK